MGWTDGRNVRIDIRWAEDDADGYHRYPVELLALAPDVLYASGSQSVAALQKITRSVPIVFANVVDPVGAGFIASLARPGGNTTGFSAFEYSLSGKWLELLKEIAPRLTRVAVLRRLFNSLGHRSVRRNPGDGATVLRLTPIDMRDLGEMECRHYCIRASGEWRADCDGEPTGSA